MTAAALPPHFSCAQHSTSTILSAAAGAWLVAFMSSSGLRRRPLIAVLLNARKRKKKICQKGKTVITTVDRRSARAAMQKHRQPTAVKINPSRKLLLACLACVLLLLYLPAWFRLPSGLAPRWLYPPPRYCSALAGNPRAHSHAQPAQGHASAPSSSPSRVAPEAVTQAFAAVHQAAEQDITQAASIWRSRTPPAGAAPVALAAPPAATVGAQLNVSAVLAGVGLQYPQGSSSGRGIVLVGGGPTYTPAAFGCVAFIRRSGCSLPVEVWAPPHEPIPAAVVPEFTALGNVTVRSLGEAFPSIAYDDMRQRKFLSKQLAMLASGFQEVLFLDADNLPIRDPAFLFDEPLYTSTGLLMWPDFWRSEAKPGAFEALGIPPGLRPPGSHESGQVVLDKRRAWRPLLLAIYLNLRGDVFYPLLSDTGQGDKETLPYAWLALGRGRYGLVPHGVGALHPGDGTSGTAMLQRSPDGVPLFVHAHLPKISVPRQEVRLPPAAPRNWKLFTGAPAVLPAGLDAANYSLNSHAALDAIAGFDIESEVLQLRRYLRCQPAWVACCLE